MRLRTEPSLRRASALAGLLAASLALAPPGVSSAPKPPPAPARVTAAPTTPRFDLGDGLFGGARGGRIEIWTRARRGEGWFALARRATGQPSRHEELKSAHRTLGGAAAELREGEEIVVPRALWKPGLGAALLSRLFPRDRVVEQGWRHVVSDGGGLGFAESPWSLGALFAGDGKLHERFAIDAGVRARGLRPGDVVVIPHDLLLACWRPAGGGLPAEPERGRVAASVEPPARPRGAQASVPRASPAPSLGGSSAPLKGGSSAPLKGGSSAPSPGEPTAPSPGDSAAPSPGDSAAPSPGDSAAPVKGDPDAPLSFPAKAPASGSKSVATLSGSGGLASEAEGTLAVRRSGRAEPQVPAPEPTPLEISPAVAASEKAAFSDDHGDERAADEPSATTLPERDDFPVVPGTRSEDGSVTYALDSQGPHAVYRIQKGETLYSHVVLRFTGLLSGKDVNEAARRLARRSRIDDVTQIPVGTAVRIPLTDLLPQFLPQGHPRRVAWQQERAESSRLAKREIRRNLDGVHVLIDVGHGGADPGAGTSRVWEDDFAYDIACRVMALLHEKTRATAHPLVKDLSSGHAPLSRIKRDTDEVLLTTPPYHLEKWSARSAVNLRWILSNAIRKRLVDEGVPEDRIVFISFHADSLHESARGSMAYYASAQYRSPSSGIPREPGYRGIAEATASSAFSMGRRDLLRSEGLSRALGEAIIGAVGRSGLPVHGFTPVRGSIVRAGTWVPAVLKYNQVHASILLEACNLNNPEDQKNLRDPAFRQSFAEAVVQGLESYFDGRNGNAAAAPRASR